MSMLSTGGRSGMLLCKATVLSALILAVAAEGRSATLQRLTFHSPSMDADVPVNVLLPDGYKTGVARYNTVYLLHGAHGDEQECCERPYSRAAAHRLADSAKAIVVCPKGGGEDWWMDSPVIPTKRYETLVVRELVPWIDARYRTVADRRHRVIGGSSMGGFGAGYIGLRNRKLFGAVGMIYPCVDPRMLPETPWKYLGIDRVLGGTPETAPENWKGRSVLELSETLKNGEQELAVVVGTSDPFCKSCRTLHMRLIDRKVAHRHLEIRAEDDVSSGHHDRITQLGFGFLADFFRDFLVEPTLM